MLDKSTTCMSLRAAQSPEGIPSGQSQGSPQPLSSCAQPTSSGFLTQSPSILKFIGPKFCEILKRNEITTIKELLYIFPRKYEDRRKIVPIKEVKEGEHITVIGKIEKAYISRFLKQRRRLLVVTISDLTGTIDILWFHFYESYVKRYFKKGTYIIVTGKPVIHNDKLEFIHPSVEIIGKTLGEIDDLRQIIPIYPYIEDFPPRVLRKVIRNATKEYSKYLPNDTRNNYPSLSESIYNLHIPANTVDINEYQELKTPYHKSIIYNEFFSFLLAIAQKRKTEKKELSFAFKIESQIIEETLKQIPFVLTNAQKQVLNEIINDLQINFPANRLIQGDVGCGKTLIAVLASYFTAANRFQVAIMAPTTILANQHYCYFQKVLAKQNVRVELLTSGLEPSKRKGITEKIKKGETDIVVGTQALLSKDVEFSNLGLIIVDEQHRFGVNQRQHLLNTKNHPHKITMTATPIPRSLAMTLFADYDISTIDEFPKGKRQVETKLIEEDKKNDVYAFVKEEIKKGNQAFIIFPIINESENFNLKDITTEFKELKKVFKNFKIEMLHGRLIDKEEIMERFKNKEFNILVSTTVVEVGVDIPDASVLIIENPERYGLAQLHQLRGRIGRSGNLGYCFLIARKELPEKTLARLKFFKETDSGIKLAEFDMANRGFGEILGTKQSGLISFGLADIFRDWEILFESKKEVDAQMVRQL